MPSGEQAKIDRMALLCRTSQELSSLRDLDELLEKIMQVTKEVCEAEASSILLVDKETNELYFKVALGDKGQRLKNIRFSEQEGIAGWVATHRQPVISNDVATDPRYLLRVDAESSFQTRNIACVPVIWENELLGVIEALNKTDHLDFTEEDLNYLTVLSSQAAVAINNSRNITNLQNFFVYMVEILVMALESATQSPPGFSVRVARTATRIAREMKITGKEYEHIYYASMLYNIGRLKQTNGQEGSEAFHPVFGSEILKQIILLEKIAPLVESYLERWDGTGTPKGLKGEEIPLGARILGLAVAWEEWRDKNLECGEPDPKVFMKEHQSAFDPAVAAAFLESQ